MKLTVEQVRSLFEYDPTTGLILSKNSGKQVGYLWTNKTNSYLKVSCRVEGKVHQLQASRIAYMLMRGVEPPKDILVTYENDDPSDLSWCNLRFSDRTAVALEGLAHTHVKYVATNHPNVFKRVPHEDPTQPDGMHTASYVVRRWKMNPEGRQLGNSTLAVLRFNNFEDAVVVADDWLSQQEETKASLEQPC